MAGSNSTKSASKSNKSQDTDPSATDKSKNVSHVPCKFFLQSACQAGDKCPFSHKLDTEVPPICKYFQKGTCKFGNKCALAHITPDGKHINKKTKEKKKDKSKSKSKAVNQINTSSSQTTSAPEDFHFGDAHGPSDFNYHSPNTIDAANQILSKFSTSGPVLSPPRGSFSATSAGRSSFSGLGPAWPGIGRYHEESAIVDDEEVDEDDEGYTEQLLPSSLEDLLTPSERLRRNSRSSVSRPYQRSSMPLNGSESVKTFQNRNNSHSYHNEHAKLGSPPSNDLWTSRHNQRPAFHPFQVNSALNMGAFGTPKPSFSSETKKIPDMYSGGSVFMGLKENSVASPIGSPIGHANPLNAIFSDNTPLTNY